MGLDLSSGIAFAALLRRFPRLSGKSLADDERCWCAFEANRFAFLFAHGFERQRCKSGAFGVKLLFA